MSQHVESKAFVKSAVKLALNNFKNTRQRQGRAKEVVLVSLTNSDWFSFRICISFSTTSQTFIYFFTIWGGSKAFGKNILEELYTVNI